MIKDDGSVQRDPKGILDEEERFYREIYFSKNTNPESNDFNLFFKSPHLKKLDNEEARSCEGLLTIKECSEALCSARRQALMVSQLNFTDVSGMRSHSLWLTVLITALKMGSFQSLNG